MKFKFKIKLLKIFVIILSTIIISLYSINKIELFSNDFREENNILNLRTANYWNLTGTPIYIDDTDTGVSDWATINATYGWCSGSGTQEDPYILENIIIDGLNSDNCIEIWYSNVYFIIRNCTLSNSGDSDAGIYLYDVYNAWLDNNTCISNYHGIFLQGDGDYNNITNNIVKDSTQDGIVLESFNEFCIIHNNTAINNYQHGIVLRQECKNITISDNYVKNHIYSGMMIQGGSNNNTIVNNTVVRNDGFAGIRVYSSDGNIIKRNNVSSNIGYGIDISHSNNNTIIENTIYNNTIYGIEFTSSDANRAEYNKIISNNIRSNLMAGIHLDDYSINTTIFLNNFIDNNINGYDEGINNSWDSGVIGNIWDDYTGVDNNDDGIGDAPYTNIGGTTGAQDNYPIWWDAPAFSIISPLPNVQFGDLAPNFSISIDGGVPDTMWYTLDNGINNHTFVNLFGTIDQGLWNDTSRGIVEIKFYMNDTLGLISYQEVIIEKIRIETYWYLNPFIIDDSGGGDYTWSEVVSQEWCSGAGTLEDPYILEFIKIDGQNSSSCLTIMNSEVIFIIRNSSFSKSSAGTFDAGIKLDNVSKGLLIDNNCTHNNGNGIALRYCEYIVITRNSVNSNNISGIFLFYSDNNVISNNKETIDSNLLYGILLLFSDSNNITDNTINYNYYGIFLQEANYNRVINNNFNYNTIPIHVHSGDGNIIEENELPSTSFEFPYEILIIALIIILIAVGIVGAAMIIKKKRSYSGIKEKEISEKKKEKVRIKLESKLDLIDTFIRENNFKLAYKNSVKVKDTAEQYEFFDIFNKANKKIEICKEELGISGKEGIAPSFEKGEPVIGKKAEFKYNIFISYSTSDRDYFQIIKVVKELKKYPIINQISYWERDSKANIVEFMDKTLEVSNTFILFCSENSFKSNAVKDEWQAAFQMRKQGLIKLIPVYEEQKHIPKLLWHLLNVKYNQDDFKGFVENLFKEIIRG